jgi:hypothetical protein
MHSDSQFAVEIAAKNNSQKRPVTEAAAHLRFLIAAHAMANRSFLH